MQKIEHKLVIEPLKKEKLQDVLKKIDDEVKKKRIFFSKGESIKDDLYD
jgi:hypothetical protein